MLYVSIFVELIRSRPALAVWIAVILQAALWFLLPAIFYTAPPGDLPAVLASGADFARKFDEARDPGVLDVVDSRLAQVAVEVPATVVLAS